ncbi:MAG: type II toxin-antitoxin system VapC family toxin [Chloroflexota bacterium]|nr:type II toxin-antitoxin system VapC family toxin [Chloroflexota bacterium]MDE2969343.1 type II toxin-antitoxin system VapC family toxin [Chloroflexota bacterium]
MITAVDSNVLFDVFLEDAEFGQESLGRLRAYNRLGSLIICDIAYAELVPRFSDQALLNEALRQLNLTISSIDTTIAYEAGLRWARYRRAGGPRNRVLPDFLIGAHALHRADALLTRDRGIFAGYFRDVRLA